MYDKELIDSICDLTVDFESLNIDQTTIKYDKNNAWETYYKLDTIIKAIEMYQAGQIKDHELAHWMCIYNWIINGGFGGEYKQDITAKQIVMWTITDWIDSLSFFDEEMEDDDSPRYDLDKYKSLFMVLNDLYEDYAGYEFSYANYSEIDGDDENDDWFIGLAKNEKKKLFTILFFDFELGDRVIKMENVDGAEFKRRVAECRRNGYEERKAYIPFGEELI